MTPKATKSRAVSRRREAVSRRSDPGEWLERVREVALALPGTSERLSHGAPSFFIKKTKNFLNFAENHHGDGRLALWAAATLDAQQLLVNAEPKHFFVPAYVGHLGWVGVRLDQGIAFKKVKAIIEQAWRVRAPAKLLAEQR